MPGEIAGEPTGETALDSTTAVRYLNGDPAVVEKVLALPAVVLPLIVVGELLFGAENSARPLKNLTRYLQFIDACTVVPMGRERRVLLPNTLHVEAQGTSDS